MTVPHGLWEVLTGAILEQPWEWPLVAPIVPVAAGLDAKANYRCGVLPGDILGVFGVRLGSAGAEVLVAPETKLRRYPGPLEP